MLYTINISMSADRYTGTVHGFAARPNLAFPEIKEAFEAALEQTSAWFKKAL